MCIAGHTLLLYTRSYFHVYCLAYLLLIEGASLRGCDVHYLSFSRYLLCVGNHCGVCMTNLEYSFGGNVGIVLVLGLVRNYTVLFSASIFLHLTKFVEHYINLILLVIGPMVGLSRQMKHTLTGLGRPQVPGWGQQLCCVQLRLNV